MAKKTNILCNNMNSNSDYSLSTKHTFTAKSHENLLKMFTNTLHKEDDVETLKKELNYLKVKIKKAKIELQLKDDIVNMLEKTLLTKIIIEKEPNLQSQEGSVHLQEEAKCEGLVGSQYRDSETTLSHHFSEVMRRHQETLEQKDTQIRELEAVLEEYRQRQKTSQEQECVKSSVENDKTYANMERTRDFVGSYVDNEYEAGENLHHKPQSIRMVSNFAKSENEITTIKEPETPTHHAAISDIERIGEYFTKKLDLEQELDILYWQIEQKRYLMLQNNTEYDYDRRRAYGKEFETFKRTRDSLLGNLGRMKDAYSKEETAKILKHHVHYQDCCNNNEHHSPME